MRKHCLVLSIICIHLASFAQQDATYTVARDYFRVNPFNKDFSAFLAALMNDPGVTDKYMEKKSDTTLFYFQGTYTRHNPFFFKPQKVEVILAEVVVPLDSLQRDTIFTYQLIAYDRPTAEGIREVKKEFEKIHSRFRNKFLKSDLLGSDSAQGIPGQVYNFFDGLHGISPFAVSWIGPDRNKEVALVLTLRLDVLENEVVLPAPFIPYQRPPGRPVNNILPDDQ
jgi:hypothetical protein